MNCDNCGRPIDACRDLDGVDEAIAFDLCDDCAAGFRDVPGLPEISPAAAGAEFADRLSRAIQDRFAEVAAAADAEAIEKLAGSDEKQIAGPAVEVSVGVYGRRVRLPSGFPRNTTSDGANAVENSADNAPRE